MSNEKQRQQHEEQDMNKRMAKNKYGPPHKTGGSTGQRVWRHWHCQHRWIV